MAKFWPQMAEFWPCQNFPGIYAMIFSKKTTRVVSIPKMAKFWPFLAILGVKKFFRPKIFLVSIEVVWRPNFMQKNQKKKSNGQGCSTGTDVRTYARTYESEFIGSFRSLKTSGEPKSHFTLFSNINWVKTKIWPFLAKIDCFESFLRITSKRSYESS